MTPIQVAYSHVHNEISPPSVAAPTGAMIPDYLDALVLAAAARQPADRPADARVLLDHLHAVREALARGVTSDPLLAARMRQTTVDAAEQVTEAVPLMTPRPNALRDPALDVPTNATLVFDPSQGGPPSPSPSAEPLRARRARSSRRGRNSLILVLVASLLLGVGAWYLLAGRFTQTPDFTNLTQAQAQALAAEKGFAITFGGDFSETIPAGQVVRTDPANGERIAFGGTITAFLSKGPERYPVPSLAGRTVDDATKALTDAHLAVGKVTEVWNESVQIGLVINASLDPGKLVKPQTQVDLNVSKGPAPVDIVSMVGKTYDEAAAYYTNAGLVVARAPEDKFSSKIPAGSVVSQDPKSGTVPKGGTITFTVSKGPEMVAVPSVGGQPAAAAKTALTNAGFKVEIENTSSARRRGRPIVPAKRTALPEGLHHHPRAVLIARSGRRPGPRAAQIDQRGRGDLVDPVERQRPAPLVQQTFVDAEALRSAHGPDEVHGLLHRRPRTVRGHPEHIHAGRHRSQTVAGWKKVGSPSALSTRPTLPIWGMSRWITACSPPTAAMVSPPRLTWVSAVIGSARSNP